MTYLIFVAAETTGKLVFLLLKKVSFAKLKNNSLRSKLWLFHHLGDMSRNACTNENGENSSKSSHFALTNSTRVRQNSQFRHADFALTNLIKSTNIHLVLRNFVKSAILVTACISEHKCSFEAKQSPMGIA